MAADEARENEREEEDEKEEPLTAEEQEQKEEEKKQKAADYMKWRREFDSVKRDHEGIVANSDKLKAQGNHFFSLGLFMQATSMYSEAIEIQPDNALLYGNRSMAYLKQHMYDEALIDANQSLELDDAVTNIKAYWRKSQALLDLDRPEEAEEVADTGLELQGGNKHLNVVRRKARETNILRRLIGGSWLGKMEGGIEKRLEFEDDGTMIMTVFDHRIAATFDLSVEGIPRSMVVKMKPEADARGTGPPPPPMVYIFEFHDNDEELWLCHPVNTTELPTTFEGPGFEKMRRAPKVVEEESSEPLDVRVERYIQNMNTILPLMPRQLPEKPSEVEVNEEAQLMEQFTQLRRRSGLQVHQRAVELAKDPSLAGNSELAELALELQKRFIARKIMNMPAPAPPPTAQNDSPPVDPAKSQELKVAPPASRPQAASGGGCLGGIISRICGGKGA